jgi:hypothetical protein
LTIAPSDIAAHPDVAIEPLPAVLTAADIMRVLSVSRPTAYSVLHACNPFSIGKLQRCFAEDFRSWLESQRA